MPGSNDRALTKARSLPADCIIIDLEDAVSPDDKQLARDTAVSHLREGGFGNRERIVRINDSSENFGQADIAALAELPSNEMPDAILLPKINGKADLSISGLPAELPLWVMIETPHSVLNCPDIASHPRVSCLIAGTNDLAKDMQIRVTSDRHVRRDGMLYALSKMVTAARAYNISVLDGVFNDIADLDGLGRECEHGTALGFDGKTLIHPNQIETANTLFAPTSEEISEAEHIINAFENPENAGKGVIKVNGKMTELLHLEQSKRIVAIAAAIKLMET
jgi:citrate lyase subunit beta/citryl-CoA lyase